MNIHLKNHKFLHRHIYVLKDIANSKFQTVQFIFTMMHGNPCSRVACRGFLYSSWSNLSSEKEYHSCPLLFVWRHGLANFRALEKARVSRCLREKPRACLRVISACFFAGCLTTGAPDICAVLATATVII